VGFNEVENKKERAATRSDGLPLRHAIPIGNIIKQ